MLWFQLNELNILLAIYQEKCYFEQTFILYLDYISEWNLSATIGERSRDFVPIILEIASHIETIYG